MRRLLTSLTTLALVGGLFLGAPAHVAATDPATWTVADGSVNGTQAASSNCAAPSFSTGDTSGTGANGNYASDDVAVQYAVTAAAAGDTIFLCSESTYAFAATVTSSKSINITGSGKYRNEGGTNVTPSGEINIRFFDISGNVTIHDIQMNGADYSGEEGGAVAATGDISIYDSYFLENYSNMGGGAVAVVDESTGYVYVEDSEFSGNWADDRGGAIATYGQVEIDNSMFYGNESIADDNCVGGGGAIAAGDDVWVTDSNFVINEASSSINCEYGGTGGFGGAIATGGYVFSDNTYFYDNFADRAGGAIWTNGTAPTVAEHTHSIIGNGSHFQDNYTLDIATGWNVGGGAIWSGDDITIDDSYLDGNWSYAAGGALFSRGDATITNSRFTDNYGLHGGGALLVDAALSVTDSSFTGNDAYAEGGAIAAFGDIGDDASGVSIERSTFTNNSSHDDWWGYFTANSSDWQAGSGGAVYSEYSMLVDSSSFTGNSATNAPGGALSSYYSAVITNSTFTSNHADGTTLDGTGGGAVWVDDDVSISGSTFSKNTSNGAGGAVYADDFGQYFGDEGYVGIIGNTFSANVSDTNGGALAYDTDNSRNNESVAVKSNNFANNRATNNGGGIAMSYMWDSGTHVPTGVIRNTFRGNSAYTGGGIALNYYGRVSIARTMTKAFKLNKFSGNRGTHGSANAGSFNWEQFAHGK